VTLEDHHGWIRAASNELLCGSDALWEALCREWSESINTAVVQHVLDAVADAL